MALRSEKLWFLGYDTTTIFRLWDPIKKIVRTASDITFNEAELTGSTNIESLPETTTPTTTTTDDSDSIISEIVEVTAQESPKPITLVDVMVPPRDLNKIYKDIIDNPTPIPIPIYANIAIDDND